MPRFEPFEGLRYDPSRVDLDDVIAPPYDVVDPDERALLAKKSPYNSILIELPQQDETAGLDPYHHAAALLDAWERERVLIRDGTPSFYIYRMTFAGEDGERRSTTGVIGALGLEREGGPILPHERTMPQPGRDRLDLLRACQVNLSPIWGLTLASGLSKLCAKAIGLASDHRSATDEEGTTHEIWTVEGEATSAEIAALVRPEVVVIADGHHRFETATKYRLERRSLNGNKPGEYDFIMALIVELTAGELSIEPIHRLVTGISPDFDLLDELGRQFPIEEIIDDPHELVTAMRARDALGIVTAAGCFLLDWTSSGSRRMPEDDLDSARADALLAHLPPHDLSFQHGALNAFTAVRSGRAQAAVLLKPATVSEIADAAHHGTTMPPKTTFFVPKPRTGLVFRSVEC
ncbi:MAG TPA: DUF1015 domain-containing protein [Acidimicrobiales bacterium]|nr:DUF1015 domain-containing protein [Acidimicrobiales bacterium]